MANRPEPSKGQPGIGQAALFGLCPKCGAKTLFGKWAAFAPRCTACGLEFGRFNVGDGAAAFLILIVGALVTALAISLELAASPPWWLHVLLWLPLTLVAVVWGLRVAKSALLHSEYHRGGGVR